ncbi:MAG: type II toxin-antitoxin system RelE/ParE family toxin [Proteobacteria bacterium]|nr:type II toxin-antitoxin system RelE/ParE family toxin [Pseudomonadota bacterium]
MKYRFLYTQRAHRDIKKLDDDVKKRIGKTLMRYLDAPLDYAESLTDSNLGSYRFRIGDYRIIFDIEGQDIVVLRIGHRRELYKR